MNFWDTDWGHTIQVFLPFVGTVVVAVVAIWNERLKQRFFGPNLHFSLVPDRENLTHLSGSQLPTLGRHLEVRNTGKTTAKNVSVICKVLSKTSVNVSSDEPWAMLYPVQLHWTPASGPRSIDIHPHQTSDLGYYCDLGRVTEGEKSFKLTPVIRPNNFPGCVLPGESIRVAVVARADNFVSREQYLIDISWDDTFVPDVRKMSEHLVVAEVKEKGFLGRLLRRRGP